MVPEKVYAKLAQLFIRQARKSGQTVLLADEFFNDKIAKYSGERDDENLSYCVHDWLFYLAQQINILSPEQKKLATYHIFIYDGFNANDIRVSAIDTIVASQKGFDDEDMEFLNPEVDELSKENLYDVERLPEDLVTP